MMVRGRARMAGRIVCGPKILQDTVVRIVSEIDGTGRIEIFDGKSEHWALAPTSISFSDVWAAPLVSPILVEQITSTPALRRPPSKPPAAAKS